MDYGSTYANRRIRMLELRLQRVYRGAQKDLEAEFDAFLKKHRTQGDIMLRKLTNGEITKKDYEKWMRTQVATGKEWQKKIDDATDLLKTANEKALAMVRDEQLNVFSETANHEAYQIEKDFKGTVSFEIYDQQTLELLVEEKPELMPRRIVDGRKDKAWNQGVISNALATAIVHGDSIRDLALRLSHDTANTDMKAMTRYARTAMTSAQNAGRMEAMHQAQSLGIKIQKEWLATLDSRTRDSHRYLDGQIRDVDKPFDSELGKIMFPGDPTAQPGDVWNCRCTMIYHYPEFPDEQAERLAYDEYEDEDGNQIRESYTIKDMTYSEWKKMKTKMKPAYEDDDDDELMSEYEHIWYDFTEQMPWSKFKENVTQDQRNQIYELLSKNSLNISPELYWNGLTDGVFTNEKINQILMDIEKSRIEQSGLFSRKKDEQEEEKYLSPTSDKWNGSKYEDTHRRIHGATNTDEVAEALKDSGIFSSAKKTNLRYIDVENAKDIAQAAVDMADLYPWMKKKITNLSSAKLDNNVAGLFTEENVFSGGKFTIHRRIDMSRQIFGKSKRSEFKIVQEAGQYHPIGTGTPGSYYKHEYGHAMTATIAEKMKIQQEDLESMIVNKAFSIFGKQKTDSIVTYSLSGYAADSDGEIIAEAFSEFHSSNQPRELAKIIVNELLLMAKGAGLFK